jgi:hypothetical protein
MTNTENQAKIKPGRCHGVFMLRLYTKDSDPWR